MLWLSQRVALHHLMPNPSCFLVLPLYFATCYRTPGHANKNSGTHGGKSYNCHNNLLRIHVGIHLRKIIKRGCTDNQPSNWETIECPYEVKTSFVLLSLAQHSSFKCTPFHMLVNMSTLHNVFLGNWHRCLGRLASERKWEGLRGTIHGYVLEVSLHHFVSISGFHHEVTGVKID